MGKNKEQACTCSLFLKDVIAYQNLIYSAAIINTVVTTIAKVAGCSLNIFLSNSNAFGFSLGPAILIAIIKIIVNKNESPIQI